MNEKMFENTVLAILKVAPGLGGVQLRKALCIADAVHNCLYRQSLTGARYIKEKLGPVPDDTAYRYLFDMSFLGKIEICEEEVGHYTQSSFYDKVEPDYSVFDRSQIDIINYAARLVRKYYASELSFKTHDAVYDSINMREEIPLDAICAPVITGYDTEPFSEEERNDIRRSLESSNDDRLLVHG
jgi:hypothetical protein